jgi:methionyl-tRNA synthetase
MYNEMYADMTIKTKLHRTWSLTAKMNGPLAASHAWIRAKSCDSDTRVAGCTVMNFVGVVKIV